MHVFRISFDSLARLRAFAVLVIVALQQTVLGQLTHCIDNCQVIDHLQGNWFERQPRDVPVPAPAFVQVSDRDWFMLVSRDESGATQG